MNNLKRARKKKKLTQKAVADALNITTHRYKEIENNPLCATPTIMRDISSLLGVSISYIFLP